MATETSKTRTSITLICRLLKMQRFQRILLLLDRTAVGEQASDVFQETRFDAAKLHKTLALVARMNPIARRAIAIDPQISLAQLYATIG